jgi:hypothetical protein
MGYDIFKREGRPVQLQIVEGFVHGWPRSRDERAWEFLEPHQLPEGLVE